MPEKISNKKNNKPRKEKEMSFWEHLEELRIHLFRSLAVILVFAIIAFISKKFIFDYVILAPKNSEFITNRLLCKLSDFLSIDALCIGRLNLSMQNINLSGQFMMHMYVSIVAGLIVAAPYVIWEMWRFIMPALHSKEKKHSRGAVIASSLLFLTGVLFAYFLIVPLTINFLGTYQVSPDVPNQIQLNSYISTV
ncbi:MAG: twin-arginine translocase subunit TatC, partial [Bacteroidales bacterium]|nr:twin-arginine translocase subunit TatC [Bacteroidales bacterium]